jgi:hypothetical protein
LKCKFLKALFILAACLVFTLVIGYSNKEQRITQHTWIVKDTSKLIYNLLVSEPKLYQNILNAVDQFEVQIIYTQINRDINNQPSFKEFSYRLNSKAYFYPASLVKLPVMLASLEKINKLAIPGLDKYSRMQTDSGFYCQTKVVRDKLLENRIPSVAHYCKKMMLVSDNDGYNRLYEFLGQKYLNERLWKMGYSKTLIVERFNNCGYIYNKYTNPIKFYDNNNEVIYAQPLAFNNNNYTNPLGVVKKGKAFISGGKRIDQPMDFTYSNNLPLQDLHDMFISLLFPESVPNEKKFNLTEEDRHFMLKNMCMYPGESEFSTYHDINVFPNNLKKYFLWGSTTRKINLKELKSVNIVGQSNGYLSDCAYIVDFKNNIEFVLLAIIYTNQSGVFNYTNYRYTSIGFPFLENLGKTFYNYELKRDRKYRPDLTKLHNYLYINSK